TEHGVDGEVTPPHRFEPTRVEDSPPLELKMAGYRTVLWAAGYRPDYSWLDVPVLDRKGRVRDEAGVVASPGMYLLGIPFLRRRKSSHLHRAAAGSPPPGEHPGTTPAHH